MIVATREVAACLVANGQCQIGNFWRVTQATTGQPFLFGIKILNGCCHTRLGYQPDA